MTTLMPRPVSARRPHAFSVLRVVRRAGVGNGEDMSEREACASRLTGPRCGGVHHAGQQPRRLERGGA